MIVTQKLKFGWRRVENIVGKGEKADYKHFLLFEQFFQSLSFAEVLKVGIMWLRVKILNHVVKGLILHHSILKLTTQRKKFF